MLSGSAILQAVERHLESRIFNRESRTVIWGDAITALTEGVADNSVDLFFIDPPYNIGKQFGKTKERWEDDSTYLKWCERWLSVCFNKLKPSGALYLMASTQCMPFLDIFLREHLTILSRIVWAYDSSGVQAKRFYGSMYEPILFAVKDPKNYAFNATAIEVEAKTGAQRKLIDYRKAIPTPYKTTKVPGNVWTIPRVRYRMDEYEEHPSQKPTALLERIILASSNEGDLVVDPFSGTFTTGFVAKKLNRRFVGIEAEEQYVKIGLRRLEIENNLNGETLQPPEKTFKKRIGIPKPDDNTLLLKI